MPRPPAPARPARAGAAARPRPGLEGGICGAKQVVQQPGGFLPRLGQHRVDGGLLVPARGQVGAEGSVFSSMVSGANSAGSLGWPGAIRWVGAGHGGGASSSVWVAVDRVREGFTGRPPARVPAVAARRAAGPASPAPAPPPRRQPGRPGRRARPPRPRLGSPAVRGTGRRSARPPAPRRRGGGSGLCQRGGRPGQAEHVQQQRPLRRVGPVPPGAGQRVRRGQLPGLVAADGFAHLTAAGRAMLLQPPLQGPAAGLGLRQHPPAAPFDLDLGQPGTAAQRVIGQPLFQPPLRGGPGVMRRMP